MLQVVYILGVRAVALAASCVAVVPNSVGFTPRFTDVHLSVWLQVGCGPQQLSWGPTAQVIAASCAEGLYLGRRTPLHHKLSGGYAAVQVQRVACD